jgi:hypothetical protein
MALQLALQQGHRGLPGGSSLAQLLAKQRGVRNVASLPPFTLRKILAWADAHHQRTGKWPLRTSGPVTEAHGETWLAIHTALTHGIRGLPGGSTLAQLLAEHRGVRNHMRLPKLTVERILSWAARYRQRTGKWPSRYSGLIEGSSGETWSAVDTALTQGHRGLPGKSSLPQLLARRTNQLS